MRISERLMGPGDVCWPSRRSVLGIGLFLVVLSLACLSSPGRIDIVDGQTRFEVARNLVEHGDSAIRDARVTFGRFPGRAGLDHTTYRFPQSMLGVPAIVLADFTGPMTEDRRHFFFSLTSAVAGATLAATYFCWFTGRGLANGAALTWAVLGIVALPTWFYSTSTFDDILGTTAVVAAVTCARKASVSGRLSAGLLPGLLVGLAFNCKQPLAVFLLPAMALLDRPDWVVSRRLARAGVAAAGLLTGVGAFLLYDFYKFPPGTRELHTKLLAAYTSPWPGHPLVAVSALALSPSAGLMWYGPTLLVALRGALRVRLPVRLSLFVAIGVFSVFIASMSIFKGDPAWGPRYFLPVYALLWLWAPEGARVLGAPITRALIVVSILVQLMSLAVDPHRLYVERELPSAFGAVAPLAYFDPQNAHVLQRPREIVEVWQARHAAAPQFTPSGGTTFAFPVLDTLPIRGPEGVRRYVILNAFRPWWIAFQYLPRSARPVPLWPTVLWLAAMFIAGAALIGIAMRGIPGGDSASPMPPAARTAPGDTARERDLEKRD